MCKMGQFPLDQQHCKIVVLPVEEQAMVYKELVDTEDEEDVEEEHLGYLICIPSPQRCPKW
jgi:hypothetical protein